MEGFDILNEISEIQNYINKSNEKQNKTKQNKLKSKFPEDLLNYTISKPSKYIRYFVEKTLKTL